MRPPCHGYGTHPTPASRATLTTVPGPARVPEVQAAVSCWEPGQTQPDPTPSAAVTSTAKLLLQLLLVGSPNHIISWLSRRQREPICQESWAPLCFAHISATKYRYFLQENSKFRCLQSKSLIFSTQTKSCGFSIHLLPHAGPNPKTANIYPLQELQGSQWERATSQSEKVLAR